MGGGGRLRGGVGRVGVVLVMVCCVSSGSCDRPNVGVIYTPPNKQAPLRQTVNAGPEPTAAKVGPGDPRRPLRGSREGRGGEFDCGVAPFRWRLPSEWEGAMGALSVEPPLLEFGDRMILKGKVNSATS